MTRQQFTDEDLQRLREEMRTGQIENVRLSALLARLEAAEAVCKAVEKGGKGFADPSTQLPAWRKECGK